MDTNVILNLKEPRVEGNKIFLSWDSNDFLKDNSYYIEYLDLTEIKASRQMLMEAYFPICLAFCALGNIEINFPQPFNRSVLDNWEKVFKDTSRRLFNRPYNIKFNNTTDQDELLPEKEE